MACAYPSSSSSSWEAQLSDAYERPVRPKFESRAAMRTVGPPPVVIRPVPHPNFHLPEDSSYILVDQWPVVAGCPKTLADTISLDAAQTPLTHRIVDMAARTTSRGVYIPPAKYSIPVVRARDCFNGITDFYYKGVLLAYATPGYGQQQLLRPLNQCDHLAELHYNVWQSPAIRVYYVSGCHYFSLLALFATPVIIPESQVAPQVIPFQNLPLFPAPSPPKPPPSPPHGPQQQAPQQSARRFSPWSLAPP